MWECLLVEERMGLRSGINRAKKGGGFDGFGGFGGFGGLVKMAAYSFVVWLFGVVLCLFLCWQKKVESAKETNSFKEMSCV
jgi:hypothetical protein